MGSKRDRDPVLGERTIVFCNVYNTECDRPFCKKKKRCGLGSDKGFLEIKVTDADIQKD